MISYIILAVFLTLAAAGYFWRKSVVRAIHSADKPTAGMKRNKRLAVFLLIIGCWVSSAQILGLIFGKEKTGAPNLDIAAPRVDFFGYSLSTTVVWSWVIIVVLVLLALILRLTILRRLKDVPASKAQNLLELAVETMEKYTNETAEGTGELLASYIFTVTVFLTGCAVLELFGVRSPASDITLTGA